MASIVDISPASEDEFPTLAHIAAVAMAVNLLQGMMYKSNNPCGTACQERFVMAGLGRAAINPKLTSTKRQPKLWGHYRLHDVSLRRPQRELVIWPLNGSYPPGTNSDLVGRISKGLRAPHSKHMGGKRHVCLSFFLAAQASSAGYYRL